MKTILKGILSTFGVIIGLMLFIGVACSNPEIEENKNAYENLKFETVEDNNFKVEFVEFGEDLMFDGLKIKITNKTDEKINVTCDEAYLNDKTMDCSLFAEIVAGKNNTKSIIFSNYDEIKKIEDFKGMKIKLKATNNYLDTLSSLELNIK